MWSTTTPLLELIARGAIVYVFLLFLLRLGGKQQVGQLAPFDFVLLLVIGNSLENAMTGGDESITAGMLIASTLIALALLASWLTFKSRRMEKLMDGEPRIIVTDGKPNEEVMRKERLTMAELLTSLRETGCFALEDVRFAVLETTGHISVLKKGADASVSDAISLKRGLAG